MDNLRRSSQTSPFSNAICGEPPFKIILSKCFPGDSFISIHFSPQRWSLYRPAKGVASIDSISARKGKMLLSPWRGILFQPAKGNLSSPAKGIASFNFMSTPKGEILLSPRRGILSQPAKGIASFDYISARKGEMLYQPAKWNFISAREGDSFFYFHFNPQRGDIAQPFRFQGFQVF